mmetsp:Transcript_5847/g.23653  ORF Transcript_5847/g.23653 Transcript_5847/m.23653 type:complete len:265 (-) Transcript_5847:1346-2140(-)
MHVLGEPNLDVGDNRLEKLGVQFAIYVAETHPAPVRRSLLREKRLRVLRQRPLELRPFNSVQHVVPDLLRGEHLAGEVVRELAAHLVLPLQEQTLDLEFRVPKQKHGLHRLEDTLQRDPVRGEAHHRAPERQRPGVVVEQPRRRLDAPQQEPEEQARVCQKLELLISAPLEKLHQSAFVFAHLPHDEFLQINQSVRLSLHQLDEPGEVPRDGLLQSREERAALRGHSLRAQVRRPPRCHVPRDVVCHLGNLRGEELRHFSRIQP